MSFHIYEKKGRIAYIRLNRPEKMNALNTALIYELEETWKNFRDDDNLWVAILTGEGRAFCVGADYQSIEEPGFTTTPIENPSYHQIWKPIICAINGHALGRGLGLALGCDIRIAVEEAEFGCPEPKFGTITRVDIFEPYIPRGIAFELMLTGDRINAKRAYEIFLINKIVPKDNLLDEATTIAERLLENAPLAVRGIKEMLCRNRLLKVNEIDELFESLKTQIRESNDYKEGMKAFVDKRKPKWEAK